MKKKLLFSRREPTWKAPPTARGIRPPAPFWVQRQRETEKAEVAAILAAITASRLSEKAFLELAIEGRRIVRSSYYLRTVRQGIPFDQEVVTALGIDLPNLDPKVDVYVIKNAGSPLVRYDLSSGFGDVVQDVVITTFKK